MMPRRFRAWDRNMKEMITNGSYMQIWGDGSFDIFNGEDWTAKDMIFMQATGIKDKTGKDIYEGDIIKTDWQHDGVTNYDYSVTGEVFWCEGSLQFMIKSLADKDDIRPLCNYDRESIEEREGFEVVGNIYENL